MIVSEAISLLAVIMPVLMRAVKHVSHGRKAARLDKALHDDNAEELTKLFQEKYE